MRSRLQAATARGLTRFVGRDAEVEQLRKALEQARAGHGQLVAAVGEPGVGKSRLFHEFTHSHRTEGWLILEAGSVSYGKATSLPARHRSPQGLFPGERPRNPPRDPGEGHWQAPHAGPGPRADPARRCWRSWMCPSRTPQWQALDPPQRRQRTLDAVKRLLLRESQVQPLLVVFEDLHWIDAETQAFLDSLVESLPTARLLLLVNYRPEYQHGWGSKTYYTQLRLDALPPESANELLLALAGHRRDRRTAQARPHHPDGWQSPLSRGERAYAGRDERPAGERGAYRLVHALDTIDMPATVQAILASRIDRLSPEDKQLLQTASVIGKDVPFTLLLAIADLAEDDLRRGLGRLQAAEFLYETRLFPDLEYTFKHALTHEVAYGSLLHERRRALHAQIVGAIETLHADRLAEHAERLAHHAFRGGEWDKAVRYGREAAMKAVGRSANHEATAYIQQALDALGRLPESQRTREMAVDLRLDLYVALLPLYQLRPLLERLREAERLAIALEDRERLGWARLHLCHVGGLLAGIYDRWRSSRTT